MKVAVISTSQAQPAWYAQPEAVRNVIEREWEKTGAKMAGWSDFFQKLLDGGYEIFVISTRPSVDGPYDQWNTQVDEAHRFLADTSISCGEEHKTGGCRCYQQNLLRVYERLGLPTPSDPSGYWPNLWYALKDFGVVTCEGDLS